MRIGADLDGVARSAFWCLSAAISSALMDLERRTLMRSWSEIAEKTTEVFKTIRVYFFVRGWNRTWMEWGRELNWRWWSEVLEWWRDEVMKWWRAFQRIMCLCRWILRLIGLASSRPLTSSLCLTSKRMNRSYMNWYMSIEPIWNRWNGGSRQRKVKRRRRGITTFNTYISSYRSHHFGGCFHLRHEKIMRL